MSRKLALIATLVVFSLWSSSIVLAEGYWGFLHLALSDPWGGQVFVDLSIALTIAWVSLYRDAKRLRIRVWPYLIATPFLGSIAVLTYLIHRELVKDRDQVPVQSAAA